MTEDQELRAGWSRKRSPDSAQVIASVSLLDDVHSCSAKQPFVREKTSAAISVILFQAGRFDEGELAQGVHHPRKPFAKVGEESFRKFLLGHDKEMVTMQMTPGNRGTNEKADQNGP